MVFSGRIFLYCLRVQESFMVEEDFRNAVLATIILGVVDVYLLTKRVLGEPVFQLQFEFMIFYLPLILLIAYSIYLKGRLKGSSRTEHH